jgi:hypothetical protein
MVLAVSSPLLTSFPQTQNLKFFSTDLALDQWYQIDTISVWL